MCGIMAIIGQSGQKIEKRELLTCLHLIPHRGPDHQGTYLNQNIGLGHKRLTILGLSDKSNQPFHFRHLTIVFNGEIYNYIEIKKTLLKSGYEFKSQSDTEVAIIAYHHWGLKCLEKFNGIWAFVIYDSKKNTLFCSRDRFGVKPFYYTTIKNKFCIASEIKQFIKIEGWEAKLNRSVCYDWLVKGLKNHTPETFFEGVQQLPPGCNLTYSLSTNKYYISNYYDIKEIVYENTYQKINFREAIEKCRSLLTDAIRLQLRSDAKVGTTLSGGLDSTSISYLINELNEPGKGNPLSFSYIPKEKNSAK